MTPNTDVKTMHFLVVDDDPDSRATIVDYLNNMGCTRITQAKDGGEALRALEKDASINFIISDWETPTDTQLTLPPPTNA